MTENPAFELQQMDDALVHDERCACEECKLSELRWALQWRETRREKWQRRIWTALALVGGVGMVWALMQIPSRLGR